MAEEPNLEDRLAVRKRPGGWPIMYQSWDKLLFLHWTVPADVLRPHLPDSLSIDTFNGQAWLAITPLTLWDVRPIFTPPLPLLSSFNEINVRTYVYAEGVPGVWFFSLDASKILPTIGARVFFQLPYYSSSIDLEHRGNDIRYRARPFAGRDINFNAEWTLGEPLPLSTPGSLEFFLTERYCLYTTFLGMTLRFRIHHRLWPLQKAELNSFSTNLFEADGLQAPEGSPLIHAGGPVNVEVWPPEIVRGG